MGIKATTTIEGAKFNCTRSGRVQEEKYKENWQAIRRLQEIKKVSVDGRVNYHLLPIQSETIGSAV